MSGKVTVILPLTCPQKPNLEGAAQYFGLGACPQWRPGLVVGVCVDGKSTGTESDQKLMSDTLHEDLLTTQLAARCLTCCCSR